MPPTDERLTQYQQRRQARLETLDLRYEPAGDSRAWYVDGELLVIDEERGKVEEHIAAQLDTLTAAGDEEVVPGLRRYHAPGLDVPATVRAVHGDLPEGANVASPNHIFLASPFNHGGPFGPPIAVTGSAIRPQAQTTDLVPITIVDTGIWTDTQLPGDYFKEGAIEFETRTDVDNDGFLDGDVGHANFIAGVIVSHNTRVELSVLKVLDTFGICTEEQLVRTIGRIDSTAKVINLSLGGFTRGDMPPVGLKVALEDILSGQDRVVIAAAGNNGNRTNKFWPAAFAGAGKSWSQQVVAVAAHNGSQLCDWSNVGPWVTLAAPGEDVQSTFINHSEFFPDGWALWSGTSFATPRVAAEVAARIKKGIGALAAVNQVKTAVTEKNIRFGNYYALT
jgi:subtilisin family serine protease